MTPEQHPQSGRNFFSWIHERLKVISHWHKIQHFIIVFGKLLSKN